MEQLPKKANIFSILKDYQGIIIFLILLTLISNGLTLIIPKMIANGIDNYIAQDLIIFKLVFNFSLVVVGIFIFTYFQSIVQTIVSEKVARDYRNKLAKKISSQDYQAIEDIGTNKILTTLTSDVEALKMFIAQAIVQGITSIVIIIGAAILLISINLKLAIFVLLMIPLIAGTFFLILNKVKPLFMKARVVIDLLNKVINESILGASIIRVLNIQKTQYNKFNEANTNSLNLGISILKLFAILIPIITFVANLATLTILLVGGHYVILGSMSLGNFAAFMSYVVLLIFPIMMIGFISNVIAQAQVSYLRITEILNQVEAKDTGKLIKELEGKIEFKNVSVKYEEKVILKNLNFQISPHTKTAILGPTAAGKTQLLYLLTNLIKQDEGEIYLDDNLIENYQKENLHNQLGLVFQDSIIFNMSLRENIAFNNTVSQESLTKAINTAELADFIQTLPDGLDTIVSERGNTLSGGQKQRLMLARALAINPKILLLDDFTARVDRQTEQKILANLEHNYPELTLISVTQKISSIEHYDKIILLMEGEIIAEGKHEYLLNNSPEYVQIYNSQRSTNHYELQS